MDSKTYQVGSSRITLIFGDITTSKAEVLVSSDDYLLSMGGGVSESIRITGGPHVAADASKMVPAHAGDVVVSTAGDLPAKYVLHAITLGPGRVDLNADAIVRQTTQRVMRLLPTLGCKSVAFPAIGAGAARISYETVASEMAAVLVGILLDSEESYEIELYLMDRFHQMNKDDFFIFFEEFAVRRLGLSNSPDSAEPSLKPPGTDTTIMDLKQATDAERRHQVYKMLRHLDSRRNKIEADLVHALAEDTPHDSTLLLQLRGFLDEIQALRRSYEGQLTNSGEADPPPVPNSVFVSSTSFDLKPHRQAVRDVIEGLRLNFIGMEEFTPTELPPVDVIRREVTKCQVYLGILGMRYGYVDPGTGKSMTELEYTQAIASDKKIRMFVMDEHAPILASMTEDDPSRLAKLTDFRNHVMKVHLCKLFTDHTDLAKKAEATLNQNT
jgi:O-acetyl-ADP-ribose deacetylase (regulator of RNase III)